VVDIREIKWKRKSGKTGEKERKSSATKKGCENLPYNRRFLSLLAEYRVSSEAKGPMEMRTFHSLTGSGLSD